MSRYLQQGNGFLAFDKRKAATAEGSEDMPDMWGILRLPRENKPRDCDLLAVSLYYNKHVVTNPETGEVVLDPATGQPRMREQWKLLCRWDQKWNNTQEVIVE